MENLNRKQKRIILTIFIMLILGGILSLGIWIMVWNDLGKLDNLGVLGLILTTLSTTLITQSVSFIPKYLHFKILTKKKEEIEDIYQEIKEKTKPKEIKKREFKK